jgi:hypothetical protein
LSLKDPARILTTMIALGLASTEKALTRARTMNASRQRAAEGVWLGGVVPYGYRKVGERKQGRIEPSDQPIASVERWSETKVVRRIYQMASEGKSCSVIAEFLNRIGVPPAYSRDGREVLRGKRKQRTSGLWRPSRIRNMLVNRTYMGVHDFGKREAFYDQKHKKSLKVRPREQWITRPCVALVTEDLWLRANAALHQNQIAAMAHAKNQYLLRGIIKCGQCGLNYIAAAATRPNGKREFYYRCGAVYRWDRGAGKCLSPSIRGEDLEKAVWAQVAEFLAQPGLAIQQLEEKMLAEGNSDLRVADEIKDMEASLRQDAEARQRVLQQFGAGLFNSAEIEVELGRLAIKTRDVGGRLAELRQLAAETKIRVLNLDWAGRLLGGLREKIVDGEINFAKKTQACRGFGGRDHGSFHGQPQTAGGTGTVLLRPTVGTISCISRQDYVSACRHSCQCGFYGDPTRECHCTGAMIQRYLGKLSGPLLDRIDLHIEVPAVPYQELRGKDSVVTSADMRGRVCAARDLQQKRGYYNAHIPEGELRKLCELDAAGERTLEMAVRRMGLSARAHDRILKVDRTVADLDHAIGVSAKHLAEAVQYRSLDRNYWQ